MSLLETLIGSIAPHECSVCKLQGTPLCEVCALDSIQPLPPRCFRCLKRTADSRTCVNCRRIAPLRHVWAGSEYTSQVSKYIHQYKYGRARVLARPLSLILDQALPYMPTDLIVAHIPTVPSRIRARGYDQAILLARQLASAKNWRQVELLRRVGNKRQVGASRQTRLAQLTEAFRAIRAPYLAGQDILLVDDVITTGSTLTAAAKTLKAAGAKSVSAVALAHKS